MDDRYPEGFRPLFTPVAVCERLAEAPVPPAPEPAHVPEPEMPPPSCACERGALHDVALFRATLREAIQTRVHDVLAAIARDVLARELLLAPPDIRALVARTLDECGDDQALEIRLAPHDAARFPQSGVPVRVDPQLLPGEVAIDARSGTFESRLSTRLSHLCETLVP